MKKYEIWIGDYSLGQGYTNPSAPELVATVEATSFKAACVIYEHESAVKSIKTQMAKGGHVDNIHLGAWYYDPNDNGNSWTGKYYETKEDAWKSFGRK